MFQEVGSALQIDIQDLFQISLYDTLYIRIWKTICEEECAIF